MTQFRFNPITNQDRTERLSRLRQNMSKLALDAAILTPGSNLRYITGLTWRETERLVCAVITDAQMIFVSPKFEDTALIAGLSIPVDDFVFWEEHENPYEALALWLGLDKEIIALDSNCNFGHYTGLQKALTSTKIVSTDGCLAPLRARNSQKDFQLD